MDMFTGMQNSLYVTEDMTEEVCTACDGKGWRRVPRIAGNVKVYPDGKVNCRFCNSTGKRKYQVFNWMKDPEGDKYIKKEPTNKVAKKVKL